MCHQANSLPWFRCAQASGLGEADVGLSVFAASDDDNCAQSVPLRVDQCQNTWLTAVGNVEGNFGTTSGGVCGGSVNALDDAGNIAGVVGVTGECVPVNATVDGAC